MAIVFLDDETGEISGEVAVNVESEREESPRRAERKRREPVPDKRERPRQSLWPVACLLIAVLSFFAGGGLATSWAQNEISQLKEQLDYPAEPGVN